jgi:hypothetical protein
MAGTGTFDADWGFSTESENESNGSDRVGRKDFAPSNRISVTRGLKPLFMGDSNVSQASKIYHLFTVHTYSPDKAYLDRRHSRYTFHRRRQHASRNACAT